MIYRIQMEATLTGYREDRLAPSHSLLDAAKITADIADLHWPHVQKVYEALQQSKSRLLPKSSGRRIIPAHPNLMAALLIGLAATPDPEQAPGAVLVFMDCTTKFGPNDITSSFTHYLGQILSSPGLAKRVATIELHGDLAKAVVSWKDGEKSVEFSSQSNARLDAKSLIRFRGLLDGALLSKMSAAIRWSSAPISDDADE